MFARQNAVLKRLLRILAAPGFWLGARPLRVEWGLRGSTCRGCRDICRDAAQIRHCFDLCRAEKKQLCPSLYAISISPVSTADMCKCSFPHIKNTK